MRVLITGATGFLGRHLYEYLSLAGFHCHQLTSDIRNRKAVEAEVKSFKPNLAFHLAAISNVATIDSSSLATVNVEGSRNVFHALLSVGSCERLFFASSAAVYGSNSRERVKETDSCSPVSPYGHTKMACELLLADEFCELPSTCMRLFNFTGVGQTTDFLVPKLVKAFAKKEPSLPVGNLDVFREFNDVRDLNLICKALIKAEIKENSHIVNICSGRLISPRQIINILTAEADFKPQLLQSDALRRDKEINKVSGDNSVLRKLIGDVSFRDIEETLQWMYGLTK